MPKSPEQLFVSVQSQTHGSSTLAQRSSGPSLAKQSAVYLQQEEPIKRTVHISVAVDQLGREKVKERRAVVA